MGLGGGIVAIAIASLDKLQPLFDASQTVLASAACEVLDSEVRDRVGFTAGEPDRGLIVVLTIINRGKTGELSIGVLLSTSEGEFQRRRTVSSEKDETNNVFFTFDEPTINALDVRATYTCSPT